MIEPQMALPTPAPNLLLSLVNRVRESLDASRLAALTMFLLRACSAALLFLTQVVLARWMGAAEFGVYVSAWTVVLLVGVLSGLGLSNTMMRLAPQYHATGDHALLRGLLWSGRFGSILSASTIALLIAGAMHLIGRGDAIALTQPMGLALMCLPVFAFMDMHDGLGRGKGWPVEAIAPGYILRPILVVVFFAIASLAGFPADASTAMGAALAALLASAIVQAAVISMRLKDILPRGESRFEIAGWLAISLPLLACYSFEILIQSADVLVLNLYREAHEVGTYYAAAKTSALALFVQYAIGSAYAGQISAANSLGDRARVQSLVSQAIHWTFYPSLLLIVGLLTLGYPILAQFGPEFTNAYPSMFILAIGMLARASVGPSEVLLNMMGHQRASAASYAVAAAICVALNFLLVPKFGMTGAAIATATALSAAALLNWYAARRLMGLNIFVLANINALKSAQ